MSMMKFKNKALTNKALFPQNTNIYLYIIHYHWLNHEKIEEVEEAKFRKTNDNDLIFHVYNPTTADFNKDFPLK